MKLEKKLWKQAKICSKWDYYLSPSVKDESNITKHKQSYLHFVKEKQKLVSAKCLATSWLLNDLQDEKLSVREYFAGAGISSVIIQNIVDTNNHKVGDLDKDCCEQLKTLNNMEVVHEDGHKSILNNESYDLKVCDFPHNSIIQISRGKWSNFLALFNSKPKYVVWTDTARTYPLSIHKKRYEKEFNKNGLNNYEDYFEFMSDWLLDYTGYTIQKVAYRGSNANYILASKANWTQIEHKSFTLEDECEGFVWIT